MSSFTSDNSKYGGKARDQYAPKAGTRYNPPRAEEARNGVEAIPKSGWSDRDHSSGLSSKQAGPRGPFSQTKDTPGMDEWLEPFPPATKGGPNSGGQFFKSGPGPR